MRFACNSGSMSRTKTNVLAGAISSPYFSMSSRLANCELMNFDSKEHIVVREKESSGRIVMHDPFASSFTSIFFRMT